MKNTFTESALMLARAENVMVNDTCENPKLVRLELLSRSVKLTAVLNPVSSMSVSYSIRTQRLSHEQDSAEI